MMLLHDLLDQAGVNAGVGKVPEVEIRDLSLDSRQIETGSLFLAVCGESVDGRQYIEAAIAQGASAVLYENEGDFTLPQGCADHSTVPLIAVSGLRKKTGILAAIFFQHPSQSMKVFGVTGTNGKTSISFILAQLLEALQCPCVVAGTLGNGRLESLQASHNTTPDAIVLHSLLKQYCDEGVRYAALEASSHGIVQGRLNALHFSTLIFSNLSHDHLDYHGDLLSYGQAKLSLLTAWPAENLIVDLSDVFIQKQLSVLLQANKPLSVITQGKSDSIAADLNFKNWWQIKHIEARKTSTMVIVRVYETCSDYQDYDCELPVLGQFNVKNILLACAALHASGFTFEQQLPLLCGLKLPTGRMQLVNTQGAKNQPPVIVDYAHTPDALQQVLIALKPHVSGRLICVFGCGGDRDKLKRAEMGRIAELYADRVIVTNDNPRSEPARQIADEIKADMLAQPFVELDREKAIYSAITLADPEDLVVIAGKGHESYQEVNGKRHEFSDIDVAKACLDKMILTGLAYD